MDRQHRGHAVCGALLQQPRHKWPLRKLRRFHRQVGIIVVARQQRGPSPGRLRHQRYAALRIFYPFGTYGKLSDSDVHGFSPLIWFSSPTMIIQRYTLRMSPSNTRIMLCYNFF